MEHFSNINDILDFAIKAEQDAVDFYTELSKQAANADMAAVFHQFAREEMGHKSRLMRIREEGLIRLERTHVSDLRISDYVADVQPHPGMSYREALVVAMKREKAAFKLYLNLSDKVDAPEMKQLFLSLAQEESKHKLRFELEYDEIVLKEN
ncbi:MAG TPA: ferritin family protein [Bacteroidales bacterium]|nr:ferritin family protein [Bacteroidales bacterium]HSA43356.1 ferritin family protein [Bacteroidales bacterium]